MIWEIEIKEKSGVFDAVGEGIKRDILDLGIKEVESVDFAQVFFLDGDIEQADAERIAKELLADPVAQEFEVCKQRVVGDGEKGDGVHVVEIAHNPGVMDPWEESCMKGIADIGIKGVRAVKTAKKFTIKADLEREKIDFIAEKLLYNKLIQHVVTDREKVFSSVAEYNFELVEVDILNADDDKLLEISKQGQLFLNLTEMRKIKDYFVNLDRNPTDAELETLAQTWSEHCGHKTFRGKIEYTEDDGEDKKTVQINNLLKETIMKATKELNKPWCVSVFKDNSGVIRFDQDHNVCFKVETHNHPSALEPYGGAATGIGGVIRDPLGTGRGAKPIINTDVFCFGMPDMPHDKIPPGTLHPKRVMKGVVGGVRDYGNRMGIPTSNGAVLFDERYTGNPLVYCGNAGLVPKDKSDKSVKSGDLAVLIGGKTGRDGIHGATFSSGELTVESEKISSGAVQIGNPITEKKAVDVILQARDEDLYRAITDCGGGGLSSAVGEMGEETGIKVDLEKVPLKYKGLSYTEIWISEAQERMFLAVDPKNLPRLIEICESENAEIMQIGEFTSDKRLKLFYKGNLVCDLDMEFLHHGLPDVVRKAVWQAPVLKEPDVKCPKDLTESLLKILGSYNVCSKEWVIRQYDHEVQGGSVLKPLVGRYNDGPGDACITRPKLNSKKGIILSCGINPKYGDIDPYWMAASCIDETLRQIIAVGGNLKQVAILDNFCWGNTDKPDRLGSLVRCAIGCYDFAKVFEVPFVSGKDSLNNEYAVDGKSVAIPGTILISAMAVMDDVTKAVSMDAKAAGNLIYIVGDTRDEMGGSHYYDVQGLAGGNVPEVDSNNAKVLMDTLSRATDKGLVSSCHDCSEGGIGVAAAEMAFAGDFGMELQLSNLSSQLSDERRRDDILLFSESNTRFIVEVAPQNQAKFEKVMKNQPISLAGSIASSKKFKVNGLNDNAIIDIDITKLKEAWQSPLRW